MNTRYALDINVGMAPISPPLLKTWICFSLRTVAQGSTGMTLIPKKQIKSRSLPNMSAESTPEILLHAHIQRTRSTTTGEIPCVYTHAQTHTLQWSRSGTHIYRHPSAYRPASTARLLTCTWSRTCAHVHTGINVCM